MKDTILIMLSGGVDSTFLLYHYLENTDLDIHVHHISLRYPSEPRWLEEDTATKKIIHYCQNIREFSYSESRFDIGFERYVGRDSDTQLLIASKVAPNLKGNVQVAIGWHGTDHSSLEERDRRIGIVQRLWGVLHDSYDHTFGENISRDILFPILDMKMSKKDIIKKLPRDLLVLT